MNSARLPSQTEQKEDKSISSSDLIKITGLKKLAEDKSLDQNNSNLTFTDGLRIIHDFPLADNLKGFYIVRGETAKYYKTSVYNPSDKYFCRALIQISTTCFGLVFCESYQFRSWETFSKVDSIRAKSITIIDVRNAEKITQINLPNLPDADETYVRVRTFHRNPNYYAVAYKDKCWIYNSETTAWNQIDRSCLAYIQDMVVFHNNDLGIVSEYSRGETTLPRNRYVILDIFHINFSTGKIKSKYYLTTTNTFLQKSAFSQQNCAISPISCSYFIYNRRLFNINDNELYHVDIPLLDKTDEIDFLEWLPDGSMIGRTKNKDLIQVLINNEKIEVTTLKKKLKDLYVYPDGKVLLQSPRDAVLFEVASVVAAQNKMTVKSLVFADEQFLHSIAELIPELSLALLRIIVEYTSETECEPLGKAKYFTIHPRCDMTAELGDELILLHSNLDKEISRLNQGKWTLFNLSHSLGEKKRLKSALEFFVALLNQKKPFVDCLIEALHPSSPFPKEMIILGKEIPELGAGIAKLIPTSKQLGIRKKG